jgi:hypothetical protein
MTELYRKWGRSVRREGDRLLRVEEAGEATDDRRVFRARPLEEMISIDEPDADAVDAAAREVESIVRPLTLELLFVSEANIVHECDGVTWRETHRRVHLAIARPPIRALVDLAGFGLDEVQRVVEALAKAGGERDAPQRLRVAEHVGAALLPHLAMTKIQSAAPHDGKGRPIEERQVRGEPPNWFRPSYRFRPRRAWLNVRAVPFGEIDGSLPLAIALLAAPARRARVLILDGGRVYPAVVDLARRPPLAARASETWFPYAAGTFGTELMI